MHEVDPYSLAAWKPYSLQWRTVLKHVCDWEDDAIKEWIVAKHDRFITSVLSTHETAGWYLLDVLVPMELRSQLPGRRGTDLCTEIMLSISRQLDREGEVTSAELSELRTHIFNEIHRARTADSYP
jgi:hypothetical protein